MKLHLTVLLTHHYSLIHDALGNQNREKKAAGPDGIVLEALWLGGHRSLVDLYIGLLFNLLNVDEDLEGRMIKVELCFFVERNKVVGYTVMRSIKSIGIGRIHLKTANIL